MLMIKTELIYLMSSLGSSSSSSSFCFLLPVDDTELGVLAADDLEIGNQKSIMKNPLTKFNNYNYIGDY